MLRILFELTFEVNQGLSLMSSDSKSTFAVASKAKPTEILRREFGKWLKNERD